jgi:tripartite-type tricarboxylate transporter receptor subunit TctC
MEIFILMSATAEAVINRHFRRRRVVSSLSGPVTLTVKLPPVLVADPSKPFTDMASLIAYARKNPEKYYAHRGAGTPQHLCRCVVEELGGYTAAAYSCSLEWHKR